MSLDTLPLAIAGHLVTRRHKRNYEGKRRTPRNQPATYLLSPAAVLVATGTCDPIQPTGAWTQPAGVATDDEIQQRADNGAAIDDQTQGEKDQ